MRASCATSAESSLVMMRRASARAFKTFCVTTASSVFKINSLNEARRRVSPVVLSSLSSVRRKKIFRAIMRCAGVNWSTKTDSAVSAIAPRTPPEEAYPLRVIIRARRRCQVSMRACESSGNAPGSRPTSCRRTSTKPGSNSQRPRRAGSSMARRISFSFMAPIYSCWVASASRN